MKCACWACRPSSRPIRDAVEEWKPDIVFNLLEEFHGESLYAQNVVGLLELLRVPYTGCNPRGMMLARGKDLSKKLLKYHRVPVPAFAVFPMGKKVRRPGRLKFPLIVKSLWEDASLGIAQASIVDTDEKLAERVAFIHKRLNTPAIAEQFIEGREIYVGVVGNDRLQVLPVWELSFSNLAEGAHAIATEKVKHDPIYQEKRGILQGPAQDLPPSSGDQDPHAGQAHQPHAGAGRLLPDRLPPVEGQRALLHRGEPEPGDRSQPGIRTGRAARRHQLCGPAEQDRAAGHEARGRGRLSLDPLKRERSCGA